ncbi:MAG: TraR/DksA C4-type zinc finger protein [Candidatus Marinimicrobia bacterium]|nr:TraR/DksA C4-type zinc finger protein [Candidatus Neomarinimicrobiota bacterium]
MAQKKLSKKKLAEFEKIILKMQNRALVEMGYIKESSLNNSSSLDVTTRDSTYAYHMADVGTDSHEREKAFFWFTREGKFIRYLEEALERVRDGTYGFCKGCGTSIPEERLKEVPHTQLCVSCKNQQDS